MSEFNFGELPTEEKDKMYCKLKDDQFDAVYQVLSIEGKEDPVITLGIIYSGDSESKFSRAFDSHPLSDICFVSHLEICNVWQKRKSNLEILQSKVS